jgi:nitrogen fixation NifU-like protein
MSDLRDLYQQLILDHNRTPRNCGVLDDADSAADGYNPLCGDRIKVMVKYEGDVVADIHFAGNGCAISTASASLMTEALKGKSRDEIEAIFRQFHDMVAGAGAQQRTEKLEKLGKLAVFQGVREFPVRVKCATLAWHTLKAAIEGGRKTVTTE